MYIHFILSNVTEVQFKFHQPKPPESVCAEPCAMGQAKKYVNIFEHSSNYIYVV